jgi:DNA-binding NarL/FixJ family response regulator
MQLLEFVIADDAQSYRRILRQIILSRPEWLVVGEAADGVEALRLVAAHHPDIVLLEVNMPELNGIEATRRIKQLAPETHVLVFSSYDEEEFRRESLLAGADYFLRKEELDADKLSNVLAHLA